MKKLYTILAATLIGSQLFAGGILTNTNQSVMFTRMQTRDATLGIDAVYFNPAGLALLPNNGFFLSLSNQTLGQTRKIKSEYNNPFAPTQSMLNDPNYQGDIFAPFFPSIYAAYKMDKFVFSAGFNPIGGGGGGTYEDGLPSFEYSIADLVPALQSQGLPAQGYRRDVDFEGTSAWFGYQANISYQINDMISVALGARFVQAKDTYEGYLRDVEVDIPAMGGWIPASNFSPLLVDQEAKTEATATGITPIVSVNIKPNDQFNFSLKYEHNTKLEFEYDTEMDFITGVESDGITPITMFPDGTKYRKDLPAQLVIGATYRPMEKLLLSTGYHLYMDKSADWEGNEDNLDGNSWEFGLGLEYNITEKLLASAGWLMTKSGVEEAYQSDLSYSLPSNTFGGGFEYKINNMINVNLAGSYTMYTDGDKNFQHNFAQSGLMVPIKENYDKDVWIVAVGVNFNFGAVK